MYIQYLNLLRAGIPYLSPDNSAVTDTTLCLLLPSCRRGVTAIFFFGGGVENIHEHRGDGGGETASHFVPKNEERKESNHGGRRKQSRSPPGGLGEARRYADDPSRSLTNARELVTSVEK